METSDALDLEQENVPRDRIHTRDRALVEALRGA